MQYIIIKSLVSVFVLTTNSGATFYIPAMRIYKGRILNVKLIMCFEDFVLKTCERMESNP
jgi:hypothetical protein